VPGKAVTGAAAQRPPRAPARAALLAGTLVLAAAVLFAGCGGPSPIGGANGGGDVREQVAAPSATPRDLPGVAATISDREGPSWSGRPGDTVQVDWYDQTNGETHSERVAVLAVRRLPNPEGDAPNEFGDFIGPYEWKYGIKVRLTSLDASTARWPAAYQFLELSDGRFTEDGTWGIGEAGGPDPSVVGKSSVGWLSMLVKRGFRPTRVVMPIGAWRATWSLRR
jgi:hypothetical protein